MNLIVAVDKNWGIGKDGKLLTYIPEDLKFFKEKTLNSTVIMGRKTFESLPNSKPLKNRVNIVVTNDTNYKKGGTALVTTIKNAVMIATLLYKDIFVIGGESIYKQLLYICDTAYVTKIDSDFEADTFMVDLDESKEWKVEEESEEKHYNDISYKFVKYVKKIASN